MDIMMYCLECKNFFLNSRKDIYLGDYVISTGTISPSDFLIPNQYFRIVGSKLNDRAICNDTTDRAMLVDETFNGAVWSMYPPPEFLRLCRDITAWRSQNEGAAAAAMSPFTSESFGGYSYSKGGGGASTGGTAVVWQDVFRPQLNAFRRISIL